MESPQASKSSDLSKVTRPATRVPPATARPALRLLHPAGTVVMGTQALNCLACLEAEDLSFDAHSPEID